MGEAVKFVTFCNSLNVHMTRILRLLDIRPRELPLVGSMFILLGLIIWGQRTMTGYTEDH